MRQISWVEYSDPELLDAGPIPITLAWMLGLYWEGYAYDHEGD